jgi:SAM-dependent methyltransferase
MKTRTDLLNHLAQRYQLKRYLEIGVQVPELNFDKIQCAYKVGVDPDPKANASFCLTSDEFFNIGPATLGLFDDKGIYLGFEMFDLIFIDGLHTAEQVKKDFENALKILSPNGFIILHDCNPEKEEHTIVPRPTKTGHWNGDVYRFALFLTYPEFENRAFVVDIDNGCLVFQSGVNDFYQPAGLGCPDWRYFDLHRKELLNLISWDEFVNL